MASGDAVQPTNIICIMNEKSSDLAVDGDFTTNIDYLPVSPQPDGEHRKRKALACRYLVP